MAIINRTNDITQQRVSLQFSNFSSALTAGETGVIGYIPCPCHVHAANIAAFSVSSAPSFALTVNRFIVGSGVTSYILGSTFAVPSFGTSGVLAAGISLPVLGTTSMILMTNDVLGYIVGGSGGTNAIYGLAGTVVLRPIQDIKSFLNT